MGSEVRHSVSARTRGVADGNRLRIGSGAGRAAGATRKPGRDAPSTPNERAVGNQVVLEVESSLAATAAEARIHAFAKTEKDLLDLRALVAAAQAGQGRESDVHRVDTELKLAQGDLERAREEAGVARHALGLLLRRDGATLTIADALSRRPELEALRAEIAQQQVRVRQERIRPLLPTARLDLIQTLSAYALARHQLDASLARP